MENKMTQETVNQDVKTETAMGSDKNPPVTQDDKQNQIPQERFNEYVAKSNAKLDELTGELDKYRTKEDEARKKQLEADGKQSILIAEQDAELKDLRIFKTGVETKMAEKREKLIEMLPEDQRNVYGGLSVDALEEHLKLTQNEGLKISTDTRQPNRRGNHEFGGYSSHAEWASKDPNGYKQANMTSEAQGIKIGYGGI